MTLHPWQLWLARGHLRILTDVEVTTLLVEGFLCSVVNIQGNLIGGGRGYTE